MGTAWPSVLTIFLPTILTHSIALAYLPGMCPVIAPSRSLKTASGMGFAEIFVVTITAAITWPIYHLIPVLQAAFGIFLPLIHGELYGSTSPSAWPRWASSTSASASAPPAWGPALWARWSR